MEEQETNKMEEQEQKKEKSPSLIDEIREDMARVMDEALDGMSI